MYHKKFILVDNLFALWTPNVGQKRQKMGQKTFSLLFLVTGISGAVWTGFHLFKWLIWYQVEVFSSQTSSIFVSNWMRNPGETWQQSRLQMEICKTHEKNQPDFGGLYLFEVIYSMVVSAHCTAVYKRILQYNVYITRIKNFSREWRFSEMFPFFVYCKVSENSQYCQLFCYGNFSYVT